MNINCFKTYIIYTFNLNCPHFFRSYMNKIKTIINEKCSILQKNKKFNINTHSYPNFYV